MIVFYLKPLRAIASLVCVLIATLVSTVSVSYPFDRAQLGNNDNKKVSHSDY
jgi:hypothetical protein